jgi:hypothetical protein
MQSFFKHLSAANSLKWYLSLAALLHIRDVMVSIFSPEACYLDSSILRFPHPVPEQNGNMP